LIPSFRKTARLFYGAELFPGIEAFHVRLALKRFTCRSFNAELANIPDESAALG